MAAARRRRLRSATCAALLLALLVLLPSASAAPHAPGQDSVESELTITSITPVVDGDGEAVVRGRLSNVGSTTLTGPTVDIVPGKSSTTRSEIADWAESEKPVNGDPLATATLDDVPAGGSASFILSVAAVDIAPGQAAGAAWMSVQTDDVAVHTFLGVHRQKEYVPLHIVWGVPLLLPAERRLFGTPGAERTGAWRDAVGEDSRLAELTQDDPASDELWLLDPTLLTPPPEPTSGTPSVTTAMSNEHAVRAERAAALRERIVGAHTLVLPDADADVAAGAASRAAGKIVAPRLRAGQTLAEDLGARSDVLWPADGLVTRQRAARLDAITPGTKTPTVLVPNSSLVNDGFTATGGDRTVDATPLLISDATLSGLVGDLSSTSDVTLARQRLVAETSAVLVERPGTPRTLFVVPDRSSTPSPGAYAQLRTATEDVPWLTKGDPSDLFASAASAEAKRRPRTGTQTSRSSTASNVPGPVLSAKVANRIVDAERSVGTFASVRADSEQWRQTINPALDQLTSSRWRAAPSDFGRLHELLSDDATLERDELVVSSGDVNFFADTGRLQITIINKTDVELSNLSVDVVPGKPFFRIEAPPEPVTIGPGGRQSVTVRATALAAGQVPVHVMVTTPEGKKLTDPATLHVRLRPTGASTYWIIGGLAILLLGAGTWRTVRRPKKPGASEDDE